MKNKKAFTLIEMLVVISLIGILAAIALISFGSVQKSARDTTRKSDLKQYQTALEMYGNLTGGLFPYRSSLTTSAYSNLCGDLNTKLNPAITCSQDPKNASDPSTYDYKYVSNGSGSVGSTTGTQYVLWARLENKVNTYWILCSNGKTGENGSAPGSSACPI